MTRWIAHRGNVDGPRPEKENSPPYLEEALAQGLEIEIDVWHRNGVFLLGHDAPLHRVEASFLQNPKVWCHAKSIEALLELSRLPGVHYFWHQQDDTTLTSGGFFWTYPGRKLTPSSICVLPERADYRPEELRLCAGICTDWIERFKKQV